MAAEAEEEGKYEVRAMCDTRIEDRSMKDRECRLAPLSDCLARALHNPSLAPSPPPALPQPSDAIVD